MCAYYDDRFEFRLSATQFSSKYVRWLTLLLILGDKYKALVCPFSYAPINSVNRVGQTVDYSDWKSLITANNFHGILPATTGNNSNHNLPF